MRHWSALGPMTAIVPRSRRSGSSWPAFLSNTIDSRATWRARTRWDESSSTVIGIRAHFTCSGGSNIPRRNRATNRRTSDVSISCSLIKPWFTASIRLAYPVPQVHVTDRPAVGHDIPGEMPFAPQDLLEQQVAAAGGLAVDAVVGAHQRVGAAFPDRHLEVRQIALAQVALAHLGVELVPLGLRARVDGEVLHRCDGLQVAGIVALEPADELHGQPAP